jgi:hypothetical protein
MANPGEKKKIPLLSNPFAPEVFAAEAAGFFVLNGNIVITLESARPEYSDGPTLNRIVVARVVMPVQGAQNLVVGLNAFLAKHNLDPSSAIKSGATPN